MQCFSFKHRLHYGLSLIRCIACHTPYVLYLDGHLIKRTYSSVIIKIQLSDRLEMLFKEMKFEIKIYKDQTAEGIVKIAIEISRTNHRKYDCLIFCILSHGGYTYVYGTQGNICRIKTITEYFNSTRCTSLADKPKLFFIQACQGITTQSGNY